MRRRHLLPLVSAILATVAIAATARAAEPGNAGDAIADRVLGQLDFRGAALNGVDARGLWLPAGVAVDLAAAPNRVYVADSANSRVLAWADAESFANGAPADLVIGQPDAVTSACHGLVAGRLLCGPSGVAVDAGGNLWVADTGNHRVLAYRDPFATDVEADAVFGTTDPRCGASAGPQNLCGPQAIAVDRDGNLWVADTLYNRVVVFERALTTDAGIDRVVISASRDARCLDDAGNPAALCFPVALALDPRGHVYVADRERLLAVEDPLGDAAVRELGRWERRCRERGVPSAGELCLVASLAAGADGALWVADAGYHRVLAFDDPLATDMVADAVLGQAGRFDSRACDLGGPASARNLCDPASLALDGAGRLWVADAGNHRVLRVSAPRASRAADRVLGQAAFRGQQPNTADRSGLVRPQAVAVDDSVDPHRLWVSDTGNNRVLGWRDAEGFANGAPADLVIGQPGPFTADCNHGGRSAARLCEPRGIAVDATGTLWVADSSNNRVLAFLSPFDTDLDADLVLGQRGSFEAADCDAGGRSAATLCGPADVAVDARGTVWVADRGRVLGYDQPFRRGLEADRLLGQRSFRVGDPDVCGRVTATSLCRPAGLAFAPDGTLWVADPDVHRVLAYRQPRTGGPRADLVLGQRGSFASGACNLVRLDAESLCNPSDVAVAPDGALYVADLANSRVLRFDAPFAQRRATQVFGQPGFRSNGTPPGVAVSAATLFSPAGVALDVDGDLYVADTGAHRVLAYDRP